MVVHVVFTLSLVTAMTSSTVISVFQNESEVITELCKLIEQIGRDAIKKDDIFKVGLSGIGYFCFLLML